MVSVRKSPNMMSTTGRRPVMAAPTPTPVKPASEIGVSTTRSAPNSSTSPESTLNGVPASATSSPKMHTRESRHISSANASRTACANVISRSGIDVLFHLIDAGIRRGDRKFHCCFHLRAPFGANLFKPCRVRMTLCQQPVCMQLDRVPFGLPVLLFLLRAVIFAIDVAHVVTAIAVGIGLQERRTSARSRSFHQPRRNFIHRAHVLAVDQCSFETESPGASENRSGRGLGKMRVLVVHVVFADVNYRQLPELRQIHHFVQRSLTEGSFTKETDGNASVPQSLRGKRRTS